MLPAPGTAGGGGQAANCPECEARGAHGLPASPSPRCFGAGGRRSCSRPCPAQPSPGPVPRRLVRQRRPWKSRCCRLRTHSLRKGRRRGVAPAGLTLSVRAPPGTPPGAGGRWRSGRLPCGFPPPPVRGEASQPRIVAWPGGARLEGKGASFSPSGRGGRLFSHARHGTPWPRERSGVCGSRAEWRGFLRPHSLLEAFAPRSESRRQYPDWSGACRGSGRRQHLAAVAFKAQTCDPGAQPALEAEKDTLGLLGEALPPGGREAGSSSAGDTSVQTGTAFPMTVEMKLQKRIVLLSVRLMRIDNKLW
ncbi:uncharacterized protein [Tiliqua scincoides]|uniref:uncharacterized protein n=1 Tax=Tiliqua scincoides TaxID=71010 RepID=UPI0034633645